MRAPIRRGSSLLPRAVVSVLLALGLASCSSLPAVQVPKEVKVQVPVPCVEATQRPQRPALATLDDLMAMDEGTRTLRAVADLERYEAYSRELEAVVEGCSRIPVPQPHPPPERPAPPR